MRAMEEEVRQSEVIKDIDINNTIAKTRSNKKIPVAFIKLTPNEKGGDT